MKPALKICLVLLALLVLAGVVAFLMLDSLAASAIRRGGTYALGVETDVDKVDLSLGSEIQASLGGLSVKNPEGFEAEHFMRLGGGKLSFPRNQLLADLITVPELSLSGIEVDLERRSGKTNYGVLLDNLGRLSGGGEEQQKEEEDAGGGKRFKIERIVLSDIDAVIDLLPEAGPATRVELKIPSIEIENIGSDMTTAEIFSLVVRTLLTAVLQNAGSLLPAELLQDLRERLGDLPNVAFEISGEVGSQILGEGLKQFGKELEKVGGDTGEALKGLNEIFKKKD